MAMYLVSSNINYYYGGSTWHTSTQHRTCDSVHGVHRTGPSLASLGYQSEGKTGHLLLVLHSISPINHNNSTHRYDRYQQMARGRCHLSVKRPAYSSQ